MSLIQARLKKLEASFEVLRFVSLLQGLRTEVAGKAVLSKLVSDKMSTKVASSVAKGLRPLLEDEVLNEINYAYYSELLIDLLIGLREKGVDGNIEQITQKLADDPLFSRLLLEYALGLVDAVPFKVERDVLTAIVSSPLQPLLKTINQVNSKLDHPSHVRSCLTCGRQYILGIYRAGFRYMLCSMCGHMARVDFFYCPSCGNTDPHTLRFTKLREEPYFQIESCDRCGAYYKMVNEDMVGNVSEDPFLLDMATLDLDNIANSIKRKAD